MTPSSDRWREEIPIQEQSNKKRTAEPVTNHPTFIADYVALHSTHGHNYNNYFILSVFYNDLS